MPSAKDDVTFYRPFVELGDLDAAIDQSLLNAKRQPPERTAYRSRECNLRFRWIDSTEPLVGRALICPCFDGQSLSVTVRVQDRRGLPALSDGNGEVFDWPKAPIPRPHPSASPNLRLDVWPSVAERTAREAHANVIATVQAFLNCLELDSTISATPTPTGLVVVSGRTGSGKSSYARELVRCYLKYFFERARQNRTPPEAVERAPHLITFEDPVEQWFAVSGDGAQRYGLDYTPRQKGTDAVRLSDVLKDALRQTPTVVYVSETRDERDWKNLITFAGTGHLLVTTTHAGSLTETMSHILRATKADTPAERSEIARRIHALIHLRKDDESPHRVPALWRSTTSSINSMTAEGLGSILPHTPTVKAEAQSSFGRAYFVKKVPALTNDQLLVRAMAWDLTGE